MWERTLGGANIYRVPVEPTRDFCIAFLKAKIETTICARCPSIDEEKRYPLVSPSLDAARKSLLQLVPLVLPRGTRHLREDALYRFVLDHGDFGMHNMTVATDGQGQPHITSVFDWEGGSIVPAILSEPKMVTTVDLVIDRAGEPSIQRWGDGDTLDKIAQYRGWTAEYYKVSFAAGSDRMTTHQYQALFSAAPEYKRIIKAGLDARRIWFSLKQYDGRNPDEYFGNLGAWAAQRVAELEEGYGSLWPVRLLCGLH